MLCDTFDRLFCRLRKTGGPAQKRPNERQAFSKIEDAPTVVGTEKEGDPVMRLGISYGVERFPEGELA